MQWLNKVDDALESVLKPQAKRRGEPEPEPEPNVAPPRTGDTTAGGDLNNLLSDDHEEATTSRTTPARHPAPAPAPTADGVPPDTPTNHQHRLALTDSLSTLSTEASDRSLPAPPRRPPLPVVVPAPPRSLPGSVKRQRRTAGAAAPTEKPHQRAAPLSAPGRLKRSSPLPDDDDDESEDSDGEDRAPTTPQSGLQKSIQRLPSHHSQLSRTPSSAAAASKRRLFPPQSAPRAGVGPSPQRTTTADAAPGEEENTAPAELPAPEPPPPRRFSGDALSSGDAAIDISADSPPPSQRPPDASTPHPTQEDDQRRSTPSGDDGSGADSDLEEVDLRTPGGVVEELHGDASGASGPGELQPPPPPAPRPQTPPPLGEAGPPPPASADRAGEETALRRLSSAGGNGVRRGDDSFRSSRSLPRQVEFRSEFDVGELSPRWIGTRDDDAGGGGGFDNARHNCYGVFHVKLLRAQLLPCSVGTTVHGIVSLRPWDGKVRTSKAKAFAAEPIARRGVCVRWGDDAATVSMVHAHSDEETPVPAIRIDLAFKLIFEFTVCSLEVPCEELMAAPRRPRRQWFAATVAAGGDRRKTTSDGAATPLLEVEAVFEPAGEYSGPESDDAIDFTSVDQGDAIPMESIDVCSVGSSLNEEVVTLPTPSVRASFSSSRHGYAPPPSDDADLASLSQRSNVRSEGRSSNTPHMLRVASHWTPAVCCVCQRSIVSGLSSARSYHCEVCKVDCCADCRLQVDVQLPCGSELAERARSEAIQNKLTMENIINTVAPPAAVEPNESGPEAAGETAGAHRSDIGLSVHSRRTSAAAEMREELGIGTVSLEFVRAHVFEIPIPVDKDPAILKEEAGVKKGDYYMRVTLSGGTGSKRTRTMQNTGRPKFDSDEMKFTVPHYGTEFRIELVDATSNKSIGAGFCSTQSFLQRQRDAFVHEQGLPLLAPFRGPPHIDPRILTLDLRSGVKTSSEFFAPSKTQAGSSADKANSGDVIGVVDFKAKVEEDFASLFGQRPYACPPRPPESFNVSVFGAHLARLSGLIVDIRGMIEWYIYIVGWNNPVITLASMVSFVYFCWHFDLEYIGCVPLFVLLVWMTCLAFVRYRGGLKRHQLDKEIREHRKNMNVTVDHRLHRPAGRISVGVESGRNIRSVDLGLPGVTFCRVYWDPKRYLEGSREKKLLALDNLTDATHEIGATNSLYSMSPKWKKLNASDEALRLKYLLPSSSDGDFFGYHSTEDQVEDIEFPVLQPLTVSQGGGLPVLTSWNDSPGAIVFEVKFQDAIALVPGSEYTLGEVVIPFAKLTHHKEISGWFRVLDEGTTRMVSLGASDDERSDSPQINIRVKWTPPLSSAEGPSETDREASLVIQEELLRAAISSKERKLGFLGSSLGAINSVRGLGDHLLMVQNTLGSALDVIGLVRCALNFSDPYKSTFIYWGVLLLWVLLAMIPTRVLVIVGGLAQYFVTFMSRFGHLLQRRSESASLSPGVRRTSRGHETAESPYATWIANAIRGLPTDEDIRRSYYWDCRRLGVRKSEELAQSKRKNRLERLWRAHFYSSISILQVTDKGRSERINAFAMIQGHRFLWWRSVGAFDSGEEPMGFVFLSGHSGMASPTPVELRCIVNDEVSRVATIFGRGLDSQVRLTMVLPSSEVREQLEHAISFASTEKKD